MWDALKFSLVLALAALNGCATTPEKYAACPQVDPNIARFGEFVAIGEGHERLPGHSLLPLTSERWEISGARTLLSPFGPIPDSFIVAARGYFSSGEAGGPYIVDGVTLIPVALDEHSVSVMVLKKLPQDLMVPAFPADYEIVYGETCMGVPHMDSK